MGDVTQMRAAPQESAWFLRCWSRSYEDRFAGDKRGKLDPQERVAAFATQDDVTVAMML